MRFHEVRRRSKKKKWKLLPLLIPVSLIAIALFFYTVNSRLTPIYVEYAEVQTTKIAAHVISKAINSRTAAVMDINEIIVPTPDDPDLVKFNTEIINMAMAEIHSLVEAHLEQAESGNLDILLKDEDIEYDPQKMESHGGVVFFVPIGQATNIPLLGNLGPKIPIRFHVIGDVSATVETDIREFGINNAYVEVNIALKVNVQIIVPLATRKSVIEQRIPVAIGLIRGKLPHIYNSGDGNAPSIEIPVPLPDAQ
ncbi:sporulation protein YunB [Sporosarcina sp. FSL W7-1349]|uniref:sporulation protein YunB n=1 Tax=Sporosarcina sp. FSL W7-1349 TaxID=2921561 RepID=UPI0030F9D8F2